MNHQPQMEMEEEEEEGGRKKVSKACKAEVGERGSVIHAACSDQIGWSVVKPAGTNRQPRFSLTCL